MEPAAFAAQLIARLERLKREQETMSSLEERLQQIQEVLLEVSENVVTLSVLLPLLKNSEKHTFTYKTFTEHFW